MSVVGCMALCRLCVMSAAGNKRSRSWSVRMDGLAEGEPTTSEKRTSTATSPSLILVITRAEKLMARGQNSQSQGSKRSGSNSGTDPVSKGKVRENRTAADVRRTRRRWRCHSTSPRKDATEDPQTALSGTEIPPKGATLQQLTRYYALLIRTRIAHDFRPYALA